MISQTLEEHLKVVSCYFDGLISGVVIIDAQTREIVYANGVAQRMISRSEDEIIGRICHDFLCPAQHGKCPIIDLGQEVNLSKRILLASGDAKIPILKRVSRMAIGDRTYLLESFTDISKQHERETELEMLSRTDILTGLSNRLHMMDVLKGEIESCEACGKVDSLILLDIDNFKLVNDRYGHSVGDDVLREIGSILRSAMRSSDDIFRWGGEEFVMLIRNAGSSVSTDIAERIRVMMEEHTFPVVGRVTASFGVTEHLSGESFEKWFARTDFCLMAAKAGGRNLVFPWDDLRTDEQAEEEIRSINASSS